MRQRSKHLGTIGFGQLPFRPQIGSILYLESASESYEETF